MKHHAENLNQAVKTLLDEWPQQGYSRIERRALEYILEEHLFGEPALVVHWLSFGALTTVVWVHFPVRDPHHLSVVTLWQLHVAVMLKAMPPVFQISAGSPMVAWTGFSRASRLRQMRKKDLTTHFQINWP